MSVAEKVISILNAVLISLCSLIRLLNIVFTPGMNKNKIDAA